MSIIEYLQAIKIKVDEFVFLKVPMDKEDITDKVLEELGDGFEEVARIVNGRDLSISFDELHDRLIIAESQLPANSTNQFPITANYSNKSGGRKNHSNQHSQQPNQWRPQHYHSQFQNHNSSNFRSPYTVSNQSYNNNANWTQSYSHN